MRKTNRMICLLLTVLMVVGMVSVIPVNAEIEPVSYIAEKVTSGELSEGDQLIICVDNNSAAIGTELSGSRIKPKDVTISTDGEKSVLTDAPYMVALFTVSYSENEKLLLHADEGWPEFRSRLNSTIWSPTRMKTTTSRSSTRTISSAGWRRCPRTNISDSRLSNAGYIEVVTDCSNAR